MIWVIIKIRSVHNLLRNIKFNFFRGSCCRPLSAPLPLKISFCGPWSSSPLVESDLRSGPCSFGSDRMHIRCVYDPIRSSSPLVQSVPIRKLLPKIRLYMTWLERIQSFTVYRWKTLLDKRMVSQIYLCKVPNWFEFLSLLQVFGFIAMVLFAIDALIYFLMYCAPRVRTTATAPAVPT